MIDISKQPCRLEFHPVGKQIEVVIPGGPMDFPTVEEALRYLFVAMGNVPEYAECATLLVGEVAAAAGGNQLRALARRCGCLPCAHCGGSGNEPEATRAAKSKSLEYRPCTACGGSGFPKK